jgi:large subunit ribosomal protein L20
MTRVKRGVVARRKRKKILSLAKGAIGANSRLIRIAQQHTIKALRFSYNGRRERKRKYNALWLVRLNARVRVYGSKYSSFLYYIRRIKCLLNRKTLAQLSIFDPASFRTLLSLFFL